VTATEGQGQAQLSRDVKAKALALGFEACGISVAQKLDDEARKLEQWLSEGRHAGMSWMERHFDKRTDPRELVPGAKSVISVLCNYYQPLDQPTDTRTGKVSRYAWNDDYHDVLKERLAQLFDWLRERVGDVSGRAFVDSAPVMDKAWASRSGIGWIGKNSNLITPKLGSFFFLGELIVDVRLQPDGPMPDYCGSCTRCIDACPTDAIYRPYAIDSNRCISYLTIEHRGDDIPRELKEKMGGWIYGCDVCQDVCPWNKFSRPTAEPRFMPRPNIRDVSLEEWMELDLEGFRARFRRSPVKRAKYDGFRRNVRIALQDRESPKES